MTGSKLVLVFVKYPEPGRVKTRLARAVGEAEAAAIYRRLVGGVFGVLGVLEGVVVRVLYDPPEREREVVGWISGLWGGAGELEYRAQAVGDLGRRLEGAFEEGFGDGYGMVAAVGTDCVDLTGETFTRAWGFLGEKEVVLGPSVDGGYYFVGLRAPQPSLFRGIPWSTGEVTGATLRAAAQAGLAVGMLGVLRDVDGVEDWREVEGRVEGEG